jgi:dTDP-4-amino-4,6-dideoxygalactose transaminase
MDVPVKPPVTMPYQTRHVYNQFAIQCADRDALQGHLKQHGIGSEVYYPLPLHLQKCFAHLGYKPGDFPVSERLAKESLAVPIFSELRPDGIGYICDSIASFYANRASH